MDPFLNLLIQVLPFLLIISVWIFIMRRMAKFNKNNKNKFVDNQNETLDVLKQIRDELKEMNQNNLRK